MAVYKHKHTGAIASVREGAQLGSDWELHGEKEAAKPAAKPAAKKPAAKKE